MTTTPQADKLIATRVRQGANPTECTQLLNDLATAHTGDNLASALEHHSFATAASAEHAAHALEIERIDNHVTAVAALLPFPVEVEAEMGGMFTLQILLGTRTPDTAPDRAGINPHVLRATWWIETADGEASEDSGIPATADPALVAYWLTQRAIALGSPAAAHSREPLSA
ncbi:MULTISPECIES: hypothetical protein [unclassified Microbacterium]|uniref:hypothetical protein n=1 Tax=unclassified Microbacterium TaxID=2609290 RepID=UPI000CFAD298|nr:MULTISPECIES: hypothetical protein [unclassified Microbacterium]PQZ53153.1 hypothetical protein CQ032_15725 [Microbacterium sp. MYb43]PQZ74695.1 hypothetical protein CQ031_15070 [Microbacterium sp. MYb40]PRB18783.1 hypothetical protein CQ040_16375 [Microbacterium sp. MYb54]PRB23643.1 hypothetical protein CQ037_17175 [Microbacterium sp. MYb50]PRB63348.1 hypothetical protein CQ021_16730 [Microbacterium sp. MYb24]